MSGRSVLEPQQIVWDRTGLRLVLDARYLRPVHDGISRYTAGIAHGLAQVMARGQQAVDVVVMVSDPAQLGHLPPFPHVLGPDPVSAGEVTTARALNRIRPDVVFSPMQTMGSLGRDFGLILTLHDTIYYRHRTPPQGLPLPVRLGWRAFHWGTLPQRVALDRADAVATVSYTSADEIRDMGLTRRPVRVVADAMDPAEAAPRETTLERFEGRGRDLVYMGSFMPYKDVETLVRAAARMPDRTVHLLSRIAPQRRAALQALAGDADLVFHDGTPEQEYRELLAACAALVMPSRAEGFGLPVLEAMAAGAPVICTDLPILREVSGDHALFFPAGDDDALAARVRQLEDRAAVRERMLAGLEQAGRWSWQDSATALVEMARQVHAMRR